MKLRRRQWKSCETHHKICKILWGCVSDTFLETNNQMASYTTRSARGVLNCGTRKQTPGKKGQGEDQTHTFLKISEARAPPELPRKYQTVFLFGKKTSNIDVLNSLVQRAADKEMKKKASTTTLDQQSVMIYTKHYSHKAQEDTHWGKALYMWHVL